MRVWLACWRGDLEAVTEAMRSLQAALAAPTPQELALDHDVYAMALVNLGTAELWASQPDAACRDFRRALALTRRIRRPYLEISCLAYLGIASVLNGSRLPVMVQLADEAVAIGESNGWGEHPVLASALAARGIAYVWLGRFEDAERSFDRAEHTLRYDCESGLVFLLRYGRGLLRFAQGRLEDALEGFRAAKRVQRLLASEHSLGVELQSRLLQSHVALGDTVTARACLAGIDARRRDRTVIRVSEAALCLAEGRPQDAVDVVAPALERSDTPIRLPWPRIQALLCDAVARDQLGDPRAAEASLDRALERAGPERLILPFVLPPARDLLKNHPRRRTPDPTLQAAILEVLAGSSPPPGEPMPRSDVLSPAELRVLGYLPGGLRTDEIAGELYLSANTVRTHVRHIYAKLDAHTRGEAVARARERGLLVWRDPDRGADRRITNADHPRM
jgi:LuxR family maltose regulon positive regulatory protein